MLNGFCVSSLVASRSALWADLAWRLMQSGGFFSLAPGVISSFFGSSKLSVIYGMLVSAWAPGYFLSGPIAVSCPRFTLTRRRMADPRCWQGFILTAFGGAEAGVKAFRPAILYAGGLSMLSCALVLAARLMESKVVRKKL